jgi:hypothetical protein
VGAESVRRKAEALVRAAARVVTAYIDAALQRTDVEDRLLATLVEDCRCPVVVLFLA